MNALIYNIYIDIYDNEPIIDFRLLQCHQARQIILS